MSVETINPEEHARNQAGAQLTGSARSSGRTRKRRRPGMLVGDTLLTLVVALILIPFVFALLTASRTSQDVAANPLGFPTSLTGANFQNAFKVLNFGPALLSSTVITLLSIVGSIVLGSLAAYPLSRITNRWTNSVFRIFIAGATIPIWVIITPLYLLERNMGLLNSYVGVALAYAAINLPVAIFFYTSFFRGIPVELEEAAALDGASPLRIFVTILFPLLRPITATLATFLTLGVWNDLIVPLVFLQSPGLKTIMVNAYSLVGQYRTDPTVLFPAALLGVAPLVLVFIFLQRQVVAGLTMGAVKS